MNSYDVAVIGGGGSGLTAALYTSRANLKTVLFEKLVPGGQIAITDLVENYPGFPEGILGPEISSRMETQAKKYGTDIKYTEVIKIEKSGLEFHIKTASETYQSKTVIIASGAAFRMLNVPRERELVGKGVSYCATCDGAFFKNKEIVVVGGGDSAIQEGLFLTRFVTKVTIVHRRNELRASPILQERAKQHPKFNFLWDTVVTQVLGANKVEGVRVKNVKTNEERDYKTDGIFVFIGHDPVSKFVSGFVEQDEKGYIKTNDRLETSVPGVYACGEVRLGAVRQLVSACGEGCQAALEAQNCLERRALRSI